MNAAELNRQIKEYVDRLSPDRLQVAADFLAYLADKESEEASQEILAIPGIMETLEKAEKNIAEVKVRNWRNIRDDI